MTTPKETKPSFAGELWELKRHFPLQLMDKGHDLWAERELSKQQEIETLKLRALYKTLALTVCVAFLSVSLKPCLFLLRQEISDFMRSGAIQCNPTTAERGLIAGLHPNEKVPCNSEIPERQRGPLYRALYVRYA